MNAIIAAFLLVFLAAFSGGTNAFAGTDAPVPTVVTIATDKIEIQAHDDAQSQSKMAAVDRAEPLAKSPNSCGAVRSQCRAGGGWRAFDELE